MKTQDGGVAMPARYTRDRGIVKRGFWRKIRRTLGRVPFSEDAVAAFYCAVDPATPFRVKAVLFGALAYFVMPIDAIPDVLVAIGYADDAAILIAAVRAVSGAITDSHRQAARRWLAQELAQNWGQTPFPADAIGLQRLAHACGNGV
jgi:uncharacterized membrane protein YkvA (DUF1232 family)